MRVDCFTRCGRFAGSAIEIAPHHRLRKLALRAAITLCAFVATPPAWSQSRLPAHPASGASEIIATEVTFQRFKANGNTGELEKMMLSEFVEIEQQLMTRDQVLAQVRRIQSSPCRLAQVKMIEPKVTLLSPEIATIVYRASQAVTCGSNSFTLLANVSSVWVRRDGRWQLEIHAEYVDSAKAG